MITIKRKVHFQQGQRTRKELCRGEGGENSSAPAGRVPRISRLMALAIRLDQLIRDGVVTDQAELARLGHVSRARLTQIMNLLYLAPDFKNSFCSCQPSSGGATQSRRSKFDRLRRWRIGASRGGCGTDSNWSIRSTYNHSSSLSNASISGLRRW